MFEIIDDENKRIIISLHLETIYMEMRLKTHIKNCSRLFSQDKLDKSCIDNIIGNKYKDRKYKNYECIVDFQHIKYIVPNTKQIFLEWLKCLPGRKICNCKQFELRQDIINLNIEEENKLDYREAFNDYGKKYIAQKCCNAEGYTTQIGIELGVYIDLKKIINESNEILRWCYILAYDLNNYFITIDEGLEKKKVFFCHTLNGSYIAGILSQLLGYDLVYVDHLGPYNKLNKVDFYKGGDCTEEFIIVSDMVCQGNEFLRAQNIVDYMGGTVRGCIGILNMDIASVLKQYPINVFAIKYTPKDACNELGYTIRTKLCNQQCSDCKRKEDE